MVLAGVLLAAGCGTSAGGAPTSTPGVAAAPAPAGASSPPAAVSTGAVVEGRRSAADVAFVRGLIPHHQAGIALAREVAKRPANQTLAEAIIVTQQDEVVRMTGWLAAWGESAPASTPAAPAAADPVAALAAHQREAVRMAQREQAAGTNPTALSFARQVVESRTAQIDQLTHS